MGGNAEDPRVHKSYKFELLKARRALLNSVWMPATSASYGATGSDSLRSASLYSQTLGYNPSNSCVLSMGNRPHPTERWSRCAYVDVRVPVWQVKQLRWPRGLLGSAVSLRCRERAQEGVRDDAWGLCPQQPNSLIPSSELSDHQGSCDYHAGRKKKTSEDMRDAALMIPHERKSHQNCNAPSQTSRSAFGAAIDVSKTRNLGRGLQVRSW